MIIFRAVEQPPGFSCDSSYGWSEIAAGGIEVYNVPGNHLTIMQSPVLAKKLQACLDKLDK
jgi:thioesterase domain-containing protein